MDLPDSPGDALCDVTFYDVFEAVDFFVLSKLGRLHVLLEEVDLLLQVTLHQPFHLSMEHIVKKEQKTHQTRTASIVLGGSQLVNAVDYFSARQYRENSCV